MLSRNFLPAPERMGLFVEVPGLGRKDVLGRSDMILKNIVASVWRGLSRRLKLKSDQRQGQTNFSVNLSGL